MYTYMSTRRVYDNWEKLVEATLKRDLLRELALCPSFSSSSSIASTSYDTSSRFEDSPFHVNDLDAPSTSSSSQGVVVGSSSSNRATNARRFAARLFAAPATVFANYIRKKPPHKHVVDDLSEVVLGDLKRFSIEEVQVALDSFSNEDFLGITRFGEVNKGRLADGSLVAVKRLRERTSHGGELEFQTRIKIAKMTMHPNLIRLLGICVTPTEKILVYSYFSNRSVASCLRDRSEAQPILDWSKRKPIAVGSARGLAYLHDQCDPKIIFRDFSAANILLDENFEAVIGGFGMAVFMDHHDTHIPIDAYDDAYDTSGYYGTIGHIAPEHLSTNKCSEKTDVYSYGVMLLELITGKSAFDLSSLANDDNEMLLDWVKLLLKERRLETIVDANLGASYIIEEVEQLIQVALLCTQDSPSDCPEMFEVVRLLQGDGLAERWEEFQKEEMLRNQNQIISNNTRFTDYMSDTEQEEFNEPR